MLSGSLLFIGRSPSVFLCGKVNELTIWEGEIMCCVCWEGKQKRNNGAKFLNKDSNCELEHRQYRFQNGLEMENHPRCSVKILMHAKGMLKTCSKILPQFSMCVLGKLHVFAIYGLQKYYRRSKMFVALHLPLCALQWPGHGVCCSRRYPIVTVPYSPQMHTSYCYWVTCK